MNIYDKARLKYRPEKIRVLFVAEAPPENEERFFYYEDTKNHDALFVNLVRALYEDYRNAEISEIRLNKKVLLERFGNDGYYLVDALPEPISLKLSSREREKLIEARTNDIISQIRELNPENGVILIKATVFHALYDEFIKAKIYTRNDRPIPFPASGQQNIFQNSINDILLP